VEDKSGKRILVIGSYNVGFSFRLDRLPAWGETIIGRNFTVSNGGKGANQAVAAARLGGKVSFIGCVGRDDYGTAGIRMLQNEGIHTHYVRISEQSHTGVGFIFLNDQGENCIVVDPGANYDLLPDDLEEHPEFASSDLLLVQLESRIDTIRRAMEIGRELGKTVLLNPAPAREGLDDLIRLATIVTPNESELLILNGEDPSQKLTEEQCERLARRLIGLGPEAVVVTRGEQGAMLVTKEKTDASFLVPTVQAVDTTGAGDSFNGALAAALAEGKKLTEAVQFACFAGAFCVTKQDVIPALPTRAQLEQFLSRVLK